MNAGELRHLLTFQTKTEARDSFGSAVETWTDAFTAWGRFEPTGTREFPQAQKRNAETIGRFRIRYRSGIDADTHRIVFDGRIFDIQPPVDMSGSRRELLIEASETK
jgi:SPP1 family predicted phage head-tail adaptor